MDWIKLAKDVGFEDACELNMESLQVMPEVREMCAADRCHIYGTRWACPPGCGSLEQCRSRIERYVSGILVQTIGALEDDFDAEGIAEFNTVDFMHLSRKGHSQLAAKLAELVPGLV